VRVAALVLLVGVSVIVASGCGDSDDTSSPPALKLQRADLIAAVRPLAALEGPVAKEVAATKIAWPLIVDGLPADVTSIARQPITAATSKAAAIPIPPLFEEVKARTLTGPAAEIVGLFRSFKLLSTRGWTLTSAAIDQIEHGSSAAARFARENVALYIDSIYDGHFTLAQIGKQLHDGYRRLGGPGAFGSALTQSEVDALTRTYSETSDRLHPHVGVKLGS
jgi:hypothetical protein